MDFLYLLEGLAIGFLLATPVGPIGVLCVRRTLMYGRRQGFIVGLSGASADIVYALIAAFGVTFISNFIQEWQLWMRLGGGVLLLVLGFQIFRSNPLAEATAVRLKLPRRTFVTTFLLALTNPMSMFGFGAVFSSTRIVQTTTGRISLFMLVTGVFFGSLLWFSLLTSATYVYKKKLANGGLAMVNKIAGVLFILFGAVNVWSCASR
ncbi:MAG: LysE family translocator [Ignavibacteriae bacterium]|nr:MAG: LysE family translocator [Ignavibacteriota bacterium]